MHRHVARLAVEAAYLDPVWNAAGAEKLHLGRRTDCIVVTCRFRVFSYDWYQSRDAVPGVNGQDRVEVRTKRIDRNGAVSYGSEGVPDRPANGEAPAF